MTDSELIACALAGRVDAFDVLLGRYFEAGARFAFRMLGNRADAEDALQEACIKVYRALQTYRERDAFRGWFFRILANQCRDTARRRRRRESRLVPETLGFEAAGSLMQAERPEPGDFGFGDELQRALDELEPLLREAVILKHGEGMDYVEMAQVTGASISALKMRVKRACDILRPRLKEWNHERS